MSILSNKSSIEQSEFVFVAMSFRPEFRSIYDNAIVKACSKNHLLAWRADEYQISSEPMIGTMKDKMANCKFFIADISGSSLNVFYEIGYLHSLGKKGFFISQHRENPPHYIHDFGLIRCFPGPANLNKLIKTLDLQIKYVLQKLPSAQ